MSRFFINRPIVAMVIAILIVLVGGVALSGLAVAEFPEVTPPTVNITAVYPGANAQVVEQTVTTPLEQAINGIDKLTYLSSSSSNDGTVTITATFEMGTDPDLAAVQVQNRVQQANAQLPSEVLRGGVTVQKSQGSVLLVVSLFSPKQTYDRLFLSNYATLNIRDALMRVPGVGNATIFGATDYAMRIWVNPDRLAALSLSTTDLANAIKAQNIQVPAGQVGGPPIRAGQEFSYVVRTQGRFERPEEFGEIVVRTNADGSRMLLKDITRIELGSKDYSGFGRYNGAPAALIGVYQAPGSNALQVASGIRRALDELKQRFPSDLDCAVPYDTTPAVSASMREIVETLVEATLLVILVVFLFLQSWRATLIPLVTVPVSLIGTFAVFPVLGFTVNTLTLFGLVLAIGIVVDDAIVVVEAVQHHLEHGLSPKEAAQKAMSEVSGPVVAIALILCAVFVPVAFTGGMTGKLYQQFALTIAVSVVFSAISALTLSPALSGLLLRPPSKKRGIVGRFFGGFNRAFDRLTGGYAGFLGILLRRSARCMLFLVLVVGVVGWLWKTLPSSFLPTEDKGVLMINVQLPDAASQERTDAVCRKLEAELQKTKGVKSYITVGNMSFLTGTGSSNVAGFFVSLTPWEERGSKDLHSLAIVARLQRTFSAIPEASILVFGPPAINGLGNAGGFSLQLQDRSAGSLDTFASQVQSVVSAARQRPEVTGLFSGFSAGVPQVDLKIDRDRALALAVDPTELLSTIQTFLSGYYVNDFSKYGRSFKVYLQAEADYRRQPEDLGRFHVASRSTQSMVPVTAMAEIRSTRGPEMIPHFNLYRSVSISGSASEGYSSGQAMATMEALAGALPREYGYEWSGLSYQEKKAAGKTGAIFALALAFVFLLLAAQYESWSLPFSVLLGTPLAVLGALLALKLGGLDNDLYAQIGLVMLVGLAAKNAILIVEFARSRAAEGAAPREAALEAARLRLRPILMTSFAFILGVVPLVFADGSGAASRKVLGTTVFGGMLAATLLGIFLTPLLFYLVERIVGRRHRTPNGGTP
jgi:hydrophobe/amphiphile efflux-1 (HAE1) family protein